MQNGSGGLSGPPCSAVRLRITAQPPPHATDEDALSYDGRKEYIACTVPHKIALGENLLLRPPPSPRRDATSIHRHAHRRQAMGRENMFKNSRVYCASHDCAIRGTLPLTDSVQTVLAFIAYWGIVLFGYDTYVISNSPPSTR